ncbi:hypothetical protein BDZ90DRAFT_280448 [Jaminaea rosea]|uniref:Uncharacterized protein n=1 Tax=Jaminaea rosea TaxID=1569628 RepID=A0A316UM87_9BASI|nr:hypothetical protein BDZ90DRAFT_280448 [Jaminaea rosea]PWN26406.1 hypothetical protein BDZ90DRAFT_280448 [Jaminaea rosea]
MDPSAATMASRPAPPAKRNASSGNNKRMSGSPVPASPQPERSPSLSTSASSRSIQETGDTLVGPTSSATLSGPGLGFDVGEGAGADGEADDSMTAAEMERAMAGLTRNDLFTALKRAKEEMDRLDAVVSSQSLEIETLQSSHTDLTTRLNSQENEHSRLNLAVAQREARLDEMRLEQERLEADLFSRVASQDRLKARAEEAERQCRLAEERLIGLGQASDREREYASDQEELLRGQVERLGRENAGLKGEVERLREELEARPDEHEQAALDREQTGDGKLAGEEADAKDTSAVPTTPSSTLSTPQRPRGQASRGHLSPSPRGPRSRSFAAEQDAAESEALVSSLSEEVAQLKKTLASQDAALNEVRSTLLKERSRAQDLEAEKAELESLAYGNTLQHLMRRRDAKDRLDEEEEGEESELDSSAAASTSGQSSGTEEEESSASSAAEQQEEEDDVPDTPVTPKASNISATKASRRKSTGLRSASGRLRRRTSLTEIPESLSQELLQPQPTHTDTSSSLSSSPSQQGDVATMRTELAKLRLENKGLSVYISKILNRILSMEGFEKVLAADYTGSGVGGAAGGWQGSVRAQRTAVAQREWQERNSPQKKKRTSILPAILTSGVGGGGGGGGGERSSSPATGGDDVESDSASTTSAADSAAAKKDRRRQSTGILGFGGSSSSSGGGPSSSSSSIGGAGDQAAVKKKAGRASVDWKSLRMPWSSSSPTATEQPSNLRPFALKTTSTGQPSESTPHSKRNTVTLTSSQGAGAVGDTSLSSLGSPILSQGDTSTLSTLSAHSQSAPSDEDEVERQRARTLLEMQGLKVPEHQLTPVSPATKEGQSMTGASGGATGAGAGGGFGAFFARVLSGTGAAPASTSPQPGVATSSSSSSGGTAHHAGDEEADSSLTRPEDLMGSSSGSGRRRVRPSRRSMTTDGLFKGAVADSSVAGDESYAFRSER